jgi:hypothetical protein
MHDLFRSLNVASLAKALLPNAGAIAEVALEVHFGREPQECDQESEINRGKGLNFNVLEARKVLKRVANN